MLQIKKILLFFILFLFLQGCLVFKSVSYKINITESNSGNVVIEVKDVRSDAMNTSDLETDKKQLFQDLLKSNEFVEEMRDEGKNILERKLYVSEGKLNGIVKYLFDDVSKVEGIVYQDPFYFITMELEDSIISTNGEVIVSEGHKRIMWDNSIETMKFEMFSTNTEGSDLIELVQYLEEDK